MPRYPRKCHYVDNEGKPCYTDVSYNNCCCCNNHTAYEEEYRKKVKPICDEIMKTGKRKGQVCGKRFCRVHSSSSFAQYTKDHWDEAIGDDFKEKVEDITRSWYEGGKESGEYISNE
jgi:hypothetical protein